MPAPASDEFTAFWKHFGLLIFYSLILFAGFYAAAIANRGRPEIHKRLMIIAGLAGFNWLQTPGWVMPAAFFLPCVFIMVGILYDLAVFNSVHRVYQIGLPIVVGVYALGFGLAGTAPGEAISKFVARFSDALGFLYRFFPGRAPHSDRAPTLESGIPRDREQQRDDVAVFRLHELREYREREQVRLRAVRPRAHPS